MIVETFYIDPLVTEAFKLLVSLPSEPGSFAAYIYNIKPYDAETG